MITQLPAARATAGRRSTRASSSRARHRRTGLPPVIVTEPVNARTPNDLTVLMELALRGRGHIAIVALPDGNSSDLADALLNALGRPGVERATRRYLSADLVTVTPFLAGDDVRDVLVFEAENLDTNSVEQVLAVSTLCGIRTWLIPGMPIKRSVDEIVRTHAVADLTLNDAVGHWLRRARPQILCDQTVPAAGIGCRIHPSISDCLSNLGAALSLGHLPSAAARLQLSELIRSSELTEQQRLALNVRHGRRTVVPAAAALALAGINGTRQRALTVGSTSVTGDLVRVDHAVHLTGAARTAVAMQRLYARIVGQRTAQPLMTLDGKPMQAHALQAMADSLLRPPATRAG